MAYQALYRQWRPKDFSHMVGQETIIETLRHQVQTGRIAHAYLFCGSRGTGKTSTAKILARAINCEEPRDGDPCGKCATCQRLLTDESLDIIEIDAASNRGIDDARNIRETVKYPPQFGRFKVYIVDEVHMLTTEASNALLKTLEEPPAYVVFILATTEPQKLPATILSRCQRFDFGRIPVQKIQGRLREAVEGASAEATDEALFAIARAAEGGMRDALSILDMCIGYGKKVDESIVQMVLGTSDRGFMFSFSRAISEENAAEVIRLIDRMMRDGKDPLAFSRSFCDHLRMMITAKLCSKETASLLDLADETAADYIRESEKIQISRLMEILEQFMLLETNLRYASSPRIALENTSLKCCLRTKEPDILSISDRISEIENQMQELQRQIQSGVVSAAHSERAAEKSETFETSKQQKKSNMRTPIPKTMTPTGRSADEIWKQAVSQLKVSAPSINGMLKMGEYYGSDGKVYRWKANPGFSAIVQSLNSPARKKQIEDALTAAAGVESAFQAIDDEEELKKTETANDDAYVKELVQVFGNEPVDVVDELPEI